MKRNALLDNLVSNIPEDIDGMISKSFDIVDRVHEILCNKGMSQRDFARLMGKTEAEVSRWMRGTHNFTLRTISKMEAVLGEEIVSVKKKPEARLYSLSSGKAFRISKQHPTVLYSGSNSEVMKRYEC